MSMDFQNWNNDPVHHAPPSVNVIFRKKEQRMRRLKNAAILGAVILVSGFLLWVAVHW